MLAYKTFKRVSVKIITIMAYFTQYYISLINIPSRLLLVFKNNLLETIIIRQIDILISYKNTQLKVEQFPNIHRVKHVHVVTSIKQSSVLKGPLFIVIS